MADTHAAAGTHPPPGGAPAAAPTAAAPAAALPAPTDRPIATREGFFARYTRWVPERLRKEIPFLLAALLVLVLGIGYAIFQNSDGGPPPPLTIERGADPDVVRGAVGGAEIETAATPAPENVYPFCLNRKVDHFYGTTPARVNPAGECAIDLWTYGRCIYVQTATTEVHGPLCGGGALPNDIEWVWAAETPFNGHIRLPPPRYD